MFITSEFSRDLAWLYRHIESKKKLTKAQRQSQVIRRLLDRKVCSGASAQITRKGEKLLAKVHTHTLRYRAGVPFDPSNHTVTQSQLTTKAYDWKRQKLHKGRYLLYTTGFVLEVRETNPFVATSQDLDSASSSIILSLLADNSLDKMIPRLQPKVYQNKYIDGIGMVWLVSKSGKITLPIQETFYYLITHQGYKDIQFHGIGTPRDNNVIRVTASSKKGNRMVCSLIAPCVPYENMPDFSRIIGENQCLQR